MLPSRVPTPSSCLLVPLRLKTHKANSNPISCTLSLAFEVPKSNSMIMTCDREQPFTGVSGPSGPEIPQKSQKESWGVCKKSPKTPEKNPQKNTQIGFWGVFFDFFGCCWGLFCRHPRLFLRLWGISGPDGLETPENDRSGCIS